MIKTAHLELSSKLTVKQGLQAIIGNCLAQVQGNESGVIQGNNPESVHRMWIGLCRLRTVLGLSAKVAPCPTVLQTELDRLTTELGAARD